MVIFTDASPKSTFTAIDGSKGTVNDLILAYHAAKLEVSLFAPDAPVYVDLAMMTGLWWQSVGALASNPHEAMVDFITDTNSFRKALEDCIRPAFRARAIEEPLVL